MVFQVAAIRHVAVPSDELGRSPMRQYDTMDRRFSAELLIEGERIRLMLRAGDIHRLPSTRSSRSVAIGRKGYPQPATMT